MQWQDAVRSSRRGLNKYPCQGIFYHEIAN